MTSSMPRLSWQQVAAMAVALGLLLIGTAGADAAPGTTATASEVKKVEIVDFSFKPATRTVAKGGTVTFSNSSTVTHTATRDGAFDTGLIKPGKSVSVRFKRKGAFAYHCEIHPSMRGKIVVD